MAADAAGARRARRVAGGAALGLLCAGAGTAAATAREPGAGQVVVRGEDRRVVARAPLPPSGRFALTYTHSYYGQPAEETFQVEGDAFRLVAVASPSEAVLDYYALDGQRSRDEGRWLLRTSGTPALEALPLVATDVGRRTLVLPGAGGRDEEHPLYGGDGVARHVVVDIEGRPRAAR